MQRYQQVLRLFLQFLKFGCFTFGGGWSIVAQMQKLYVEEQHVLSSEELLDLTSVGRSLPGIMISNVSMLYGYRTAGLLGGIACVGGLVLPPILILSLITCFYTAFQSNLWVMAAMAGVRTAVVPIIISAIIGMVRGAFRFPPCIAIAVLTFSLYLFSNVNCVWLVVIGAVCGILLSEYYERKEDGSDGTH